MKIDYKKISYLERVNFLFEEIHTDGDNVFYNNINLEKKTKFLQILITTKKSLIITQTGLI